MTDKQIRGLVAEAWGMMGVGLFAVNALYTALTCILIAIALGYKNSIADDNE